MDKLINYIPVPDRKKISGQFIWFVIWLFTTICGLLLRPSPDGFGTHRQMGFPPCPSVALFGRYCPGCGLTTSFTLTLHMRLQDAFIANPFGPIFYGTLTVVGLLGGYGYFRKMYIDSSAKWITNFMIILTTTFLAYGAYRFIFVPIPPQLLNR